jgi:hypothetical protein
LKKSIQKSKNLTAADIHSNKKCLLIRTLILIKNYIYTFLLKLFRKYVITRHRVRSTPPTI